MTTAEEQDERENNLIAAGAIYALLSTMGDRAPNLTRVDIVMDGDNATNAIEVEFNFLRSPYRLTVQRVPGETDGR